MKKYVKKIFIFILFVVFLFSSKQQKIKTILSQTQTVSSQSLANFFKKLNSFKNSPSKSTRKLRVLIIGDSHIQADFFSGRVRGYLRKKYGDGGRGLIIPKNSKTSPGQMSINLKTSDGWKAISSKYSKKRKESLKIYSLAMRKHVCLKSGASITVKATASSSHFVSLIYIGHPKGGNLDLYLNGNKIKTLSLKKEKLGVYREVFTNLNGVSEIKIVSKQIKNLTKTSSIKEFNNAPIQILSFYLESKNKGAILDAAGLNGARISDLVRVDADAFETQLKWNKYDLVVSYFGANEVLYQRLNETQLKNDFSLFRKRIKKALPKCNIIYASSPDMAPRMSWIKNDLVVIKKNVLQINKLLKDFAYEHGDVFWDQQKIMGGSGSVYSWQKDKLWQKDFIHSTYAGYKLLGDGFIYFLFSEKYGNLLLK